MIFLLSFLLTVPAVCLGLNDALVSSTAWAFSAGDTPGNTKAEGGKIHEDRLGRCQQVLVDQIGKAVNLEYVVIILWLIQSHGQRGRPSTTGIIKNANGRPLPVFEIFGHMLTGQRRYLEH
jgi:hypothetical protein